MMRVRLWGTRGSITTPGTATLRYGGNTPCVQVVGCQTNTPGAAVQPGNPHIVLDGGTGLLSLQGALMAGPWGRGEGELHFMLSHFHWDHIIGIPFFEPMFKKGNRVTFYGASIRALRTSIERLFTSVYSPVKGAHNIEADLAFQQLDAGGTEVAGFHVRRAENQPPGGALSFRIQYGPHAVVYSSDHAVGEPKVDATLVELARGADIWILNAMFRPEERWQFRGWGQSSHVEAVRLALEAGVGTAVLFHHDPWKDDETLDQMGFEAVEQAAGTRTQVLMARDGMAVEVGR
jgi:phosphoribosyl 1,2-cyclic phosphodiesterase